MKAHKKTLVAVLLFVSFVLVLGSCSNKTCPAYSQVDSTQTEQNS